MPFPLAAIAIGAGIGAIMEAINQYEEAGDPQALMAAKQMREQSILDNMRAGMPRAGAEAAVDSAITAAIERESKEFSTGDVVGAGVVGGALSGLGAAAAASKWGKAALSRVGLGSNAPANTPAIEAAKNTRRTISPVAERGLVPAGPVNPANEVDALNFARFTPGQPVGRTPAPYRMYRPQQQLEYKGAPQVEYAGNMPPKLGYGGSTIYAEAPQRAIPMGGGMPVRGEAINPDFMRKTGMWVDEVGDTGVAPRIVDDFTPATGGGTMLYGPGQWAAPGSAQQMAFQRMLDQAMMRRRMYGTEGG